MNPQVQPFFDETTFTWSYVVHDPSSRRAALVDGVLDFDPASGRTRSASADALVAFVEANGLEVEWIIDTHVHADHLSAAAYLKSRLGGRTGIGEHVREVQDTFGHLFNEGADFRRDGSQFDHLFKDGETYCIGAIEAFAWHTPGHTPACMTHVIGDAAFVGDTLFMPDYGTARCDFPGGDARQLYRSIRRLFTLPEATRVFLCHDYKAPGRDTYAHETTIDEERRANIHVREGIDEDEFVRMRMARDATLAVPKLLLPAVQVNMRAGRFPSAESNGVSYLKLPIDAE